MKLKFTIHYGTEWGQSLHVLITYRSGDGYKRSYNLPMQTQDGMTWTLETAVMESRQHPITSMVYLYQVEDNDGNVVRREWNMVPRIYAFDGSKNYIFPDQWHEIPLQYHLYTHAYSTVCGMERATGVQLTRLPFFRRTLVFRVSAPQLLKGEAVGVCGNHPALGSWNPARYQMMTCIGDFEWILSVNAYGMYLPLEFKYVIVDKETKQLKSWEEGDNRSTGDWKINDGEVLVLSGDSLHVREAAWRMAGVSVPVFSLRSAQSWGVGDFGDLRRFIEWASVVGMHAVHVLPVNDTGVSDGWKNSNPYRAVSAFAIHPHYLDLEQLGILHDKDKLNVYNRRRRELNACAYSDYVSVDAVKRNYVSDAFVLYGDRLLHSDEFKQFFELNSFWLEPYARFMAEDTCPVEQIYYVQYHLHAQLAEVSTYARSKGVMLMCDFELQMAFNSVDVTVNPDYFNQGCKVGALPDRDNPMGDGGDSLSLNWGNKEVLLWMNRRMKHMEQYFDGVVLRRSMNYFRIWEVPSNAVRAYLGHFSPSLPMSLEEMAQFGFEFRKELFTRPFINDTIVAKVFGVHAAFVKEHFLMSKGYGLYFLKEEYDTQVKVRNHFEGHTDENSLWIRNGLYRLIENVLFVEDPVHETMYHPRLEAYNTLLYKELSSEEKDSFMRLYNNYYYDRHHEYWANLAGKKFEAMFHDSRLMVVAADVTVLTDSEAGVFDSMRILPLEAQRTPKAGDCEFSHLEANPYRSVCTVSCCDQPSLRLWWEENPGRAQRFFVSVLRREGKAPRTLPAHLAEDIVARNLYCPSMMALFTMREWLSLDAALRDACALDERVNLPYGGYERWQYRMCVGVEELMAADKYNNKVKLMIERSRR